MNILVFFSNIDAVKRYYKYTKVHRGTKRTVIFISVKPLKEEDELVLQSFEESYFINESLSCALTQAAELVSIEQDTIITTVDVIPVDNFIEIIEETKSKVSDLSSCFGRWYNDIIADRADTSVLGFKYRDTTPKLIANHILEHTPFSEVHAIKVSRFPVFLNYFGKEVTIELRQALNNAVSFSEFSFFFSEFIKNYNNKRGIYYIPSIEAIDKKLL